LLGHISEEAQGILQDRQHATQTIKEKMIKAQDRIKKYDYKSKERELPRRYVASEDTTLQALSLQGSLKLHSKFDGPFRVLKRIREVAYVLLFPQGAP
jgi:calcineurin-like phosphoesterase